ncbi:MAG: YicC family protein [Spirochaetes bacterium]|nr:YicC family protein [Spirochaetota bacterium]
MNGMTGYSSKELVLDDFQLTTEIKTVNHRFLEINIYMPYYLNALDLKIRKLVQSHLIRGKVDLSVSIKTQNVNHIEANFSVAEQYISALNSLINHFKLNDSIKLFHLTRYEDILQINKTVDYTSYWEYIEKNLLENLTEIKNMRSQEGQSTKVNLTEIIQRIEENHQVIATHVPEMEKTIYQNLKDRMTELLNEQVDNDRIATEAAVLVSKSCINEEIERLKFHIHQFKDLLDQKNDIGKKLDFICQEMHREINTIGSKITLQTLTDNVINIKNDIEKLREQVRNIE